MKFFAKVFLENLASSLKPQASSLKPQASSLKPQASSLKPQATSHKPQATSHKPHYHETQTMNPDLARVKEERDENMEALAHAYAASGSIHQAAIAVEEAGGADYGASRSATSTVRATSPMGRNLVARVQEIVTTKFANGGISSERTMIELARVAYGNIKDIYTPEGDLKAIHQIDDDTAATISGIDVETRWEGKGDNAYPVVVKKIRRADKVAALTILAKHFKIVGDEGDGVNALASALADRLKSARRRSYEVEDAQIIEPVTQPAAAPQLQESDDERLW